ncbi:MAG: hypothetical protein U5R31_01875 [Acidimicrobiia bacterium]|nr:hypothetical protein [Acidimicrobiia bacterium]
MTDWGAARLVLKGDIANEAQPDEWRRLGRLLEPTSTSPSTSCPATTT